MNNCNFLRIDKYQIDLNKKLGDGTCGKVYLGLYYERNKENENNFLAVKEIALDNNFEITESILVEINVLRKLKSRNIV